MLPLSTSKNCLIGKASCITPGKTAMWCWLVGVLSFASQQFSLVALWLLKYLRRASPLEPYSGYALKSRTVAYSIFPTYSSSRWRRRKQKTTGKIARVFLLTREIHHEKSRNSKTQLGPNTQQHAHISHHNTWTATKRSVAYAPVLSPATWQVWGAWFTLSRSLWVAKALVHTACHARAAWWFSK